LYRSTYNLLKKISDDGESVEDVVQRLASSERLEKADIIDEEIVALPTDKQTVNKINGKAGKNVSANDVVYRLAKEHTDDDTITLP
jgi:predicted CopG family antitoxin